MNINKNTKEFQNDSTNNVARGVFDEIAIEDGFKLLLYKNQLDVTKTIERDVNSKFIQFHFSVKGLSQFIFNQGAYTLEVKAEQSLLLYNPKRDLPIYLNINPDSWIVSLVITIEKFHSLFSTEANYISFLNSDNIDKKYYADGQISPSMAIVLNQLINYNLNSSIKGIYFKAKAYELLGLYFNTSEEADVEQCPFLVDEANVIKIKKAKNIIISRMAEPPTLQELADEIGLNLKKLKEGFKQIYGDSVFSFLLDYKMEVARKLLEVGTYNVSEVGLKVGYSTSSHFIAAFKKKYGTTPKKYVQSI